MSSRLLNKHTGTWLFAESMSSKNNSFDEFFSKGEEKNGVDIFFPPLVLSYYYYFFSKMNFNNVFFFSLAPVPQQCIWFLKFTYLLQHTHRFFFLSEYSLEECFLYGSLCRKLLIPYCLKIFLYISIITRDNLLDIKFEVETSFPSVLDCESLYSPAVVIKPILFENCALPEGNISSLVHFHVISLTGQA